MKSSWFVDGCPDAPSDFIQSARKMHSKKERYKEQDGYFKDHTGINGDMKKKSTLH